jgi:hypothetical protein
MVRVLACGSGTISASVREFADVELVIAERAEENLFRGERQPGDGAAFHLRASVHDRPSAVKIARASTIVDVALKTAREMNLAPVTVAILDAGGHLVAFKREDKSGILRHDIAYGKAWGALGMGLGSRTLHERAANTPQFFNALYGQKR